MYLNILQISKIIIELSMFCSIVYNNDINSNIDLMRILLIQFLSLKLNL